jgi:hypothetical protein
MAPPGHERIVLETSVDHQLSPLPATPTSEERTRKGVTSEIPDEGSNIPEIEYGGDEHIAGTLSPAGAAVRSSSATLENRYDAGVIAETEYGGLANKSKMLEKVGLRGNLVYKERNAGGAPVIAQTHQIKDMLRQGRAILEDKKEQDAIKADVMGPDEFDDDSLNNIDWSQFEDLRKLPQPENLKEPWQLRETDLYLLHPSDDRLIDAMEASTMHLDQPSPNTLVLTKSEADHLRLTASGSAALGDVPMIVREANGSCRLVRSKGIRALSFEEWTEKHGKNGVFLRDGENGFLSVCRYNSIYGHMFQRDAAGARFAAISGQSSRVDLSQLMIEDDEGDFVGIYDYMNQTGAHSLHKRNILILSTTGKALHSPWVSEKQNAGYFRSLMRNEQVADLLQGYDQFKQLRKPPPPVLVRMGAKLVKAEKLNVLDHRYAPLVDQYSKEDLFLLNHKEGRYTGNYSAFSEYSRPTLEQDQILGRHSQTERERWAQIPHSLDPAIGPVAELPPPVVDKDLLSDIDALNKRLLESGHAYETTFFKMPETLLQPSARHASNHADDDVAKKRDLDPEQHSRSRSR